MPHIAFVIPGFTIIGGGARTDFSLSGAGSLLTASFPQDRQTWVAEGKAHLIPAPTTITAWAIGIGNTAAEELSVAPSVIDAVPSEGNSVNTAAEGNMSPKSIDNVTLLIPSHPVSSITVLSLTGVRPSQSISQVNDGRQVKFID